MKLYTEEQVRIAIDIALNGINQYYTPIIDRIKPIELPSDEEIKKYIESTPYYGTCTYEFKEGIEDGIKWMKKQILNKNK
jgi:hypothetical protein